MNFQQALQKVFGLYLRANSIEEDIKCGVVFAKIAIEYIGCHFEVRGEELGIKRPEKYTENDFRKLFCFLGITLERPKEETPQLHRLVNDLELKDTLRAFTVTRNSIMHSMTNKSVPLDDERFLKEAWNWGLWCVEMFILAAHKYEGKYTNRLKPPNHPSNPETVPWAAEEKPAPALND